MTQNLLLNLLLMVFWTAMTGEFSSLNFGLGFVVGYIVLHVSRPLTGTETYLERVWFFIELLGIYARNLFLSSLHLTRIILAPTLEITSGVIAVPLDVTTDSEITMLANFISLTPGTLSIYVSDDRRTLFIHVLDIEEGGVDQERQNVKEILESRVKKVLHPPAPVVEESPPEEAER